MIHIKTDEQLEGIEKSCALLAQLFHYLEQYITVGTTTKKLDEIAYTFIYDNNARAAFLGYQGFQHSLCTSINGAIIHGIPNDIALQEGDILSIDCGIEFESYYSDCAYTFIVGSSECVDDDVKKLLQITKESLYCGIDAARVGKRVCDISHAIEQHIKPYGFGIIHDYCGHGIGLALHEDPSILNYVSHAMDNPRLRHGMVIAIEPMVALKNRTVKILDDGWTVHTKDNSIAAHYEHTIAILNEGPKILTIHKDKNEI